MAHPKRVWLTPIFTLHVDFYLKIYSSILRGSSIMEWGSPIRSRNFCWASQTASNYSAHTKRACMRTFRGSSQLVVIPWSGVGSGRHGLGVSTCLSNLVISSGSSSPLPSRSAARRIRTPIRLWKSLALRWPCLSLYGLLWRILLRPCSALKELRHHRFEANRSFWRSWCLHWVCMAGSGAWCCPFPGSIEPSCVVLERNSRPFECPDVFAEEPHLHQQRSIIRLAFSALEFNPCCIAQ